MATVTVTIDGKLYRMACDEGQEQHLTGLAERFDQYVGHLKSSFGEIGDVRLTVMAGIMVMDELNEMQKRVRALEEVSSQANRNDATISHVLNDMAHRIEQLANRIAPRPSS
ncbi:cell division protein ZapA [Paenochrobactrum gallinarii]|uniref:Cell division protein ZapA n=1 Tax=Paenochrobactrum gallinarii TaxID=643673 RepID=A0A841LXN1_9HYPH|nr:cell division protein ZapA [Paenochrobactrum gallinarii]MBB6261312.1 cell division protein ZapA [Paenochrobactrum gallinarii]